MKNVLLILSLFFIANVCNAQEELKTEGIDFPNSEVQEIKFDNESKTLHVNINDVIASFTLNELRQLKAVQEGEASIQTKQQLDQLEQTVKELRLRIQYLELQMQLNEENNWRLFRGLSLQNENQGTGNQGLQSN